MLSTPAMVQVTQRKDKTEGFFLKESIYHILALSQVHSYDIHNS